jgi:hypothetical protein
MKTRYTVTVGEIGNEVGHESTHNCETDAGAIRAARRAVAPYQGDGWWRVEDETGRPVANGVA